MMSPSHCCSESWFPDDRSNMFRLRPHCRCTILILEVKLFGGSNSESPQTGRFDILICEGNLFRDENESNWGKVLRNVVVKKINTVFTETTGIGAQSLE